MDQNPAKPNKLDEIRERIANRINDLLDRMLKISSTSNQDKLGKRDAEQSIAHLMNADFLCIDTVIEELPGGYWTALTPEGNEDQLVDTMWPIDTASAVYKYDEKCWFMERIQPVAPKELRGKIKIVPPKCALLSAIKLFDDGTFWTDTMKIGFLGKRWVPLDLGMTGERYSKPGIPLIHGRSPNNEQKDEINTSTSMGLSAALTSRYSWHVALGNIDNSGPRILLPTNPKGCLALLKDRINPNAESRRAALRHWVKNHFRNVDNDGLAYVCDHLRGATRFTWHDLACELMVSEYDLEKNDMFRHEAEQWRTQRKHNQFRVRLRKKSKTSESATLS